jgi:hypothetical protein
VARGSSWFVVEARPRRLPPQGFRVPGVESAPLAVDQTQLEVPPLWVGNAHAVSPNSVIARSSG